MLDVWMALGGEPAAFYRMWDEDRRTPADTWAQLMAAVGQRLGSLAADTNPPIGPEFDRLIFPEAVAGSATPDEFDHRATRPDYSKPGHTPPTCGTCGQPVAYIGRRWEHVAGSATPTRQNEGRKT
jgi:hypothetical protein